ncbi:TPA: hypothetical protein H1009_03295, partial [archaeon]|nr:hypothetical protein [Candidatus Naiadarchaeales archaeon SRR2090153.bin461]
MVDFESLQRQSGGILAVIFVIAVLVIAIAPSGFLVSKYANKAPSVGAAHSPLAPVEGQTVTITVTARDDQLVIKAG